MKKTENTEQLLVSRVLHERICLTPFLTHNLQRFGPNGVRSREFPNCMQASRAWQWYLLSGKAGDPSSMIGNFILF